MGVPGVWAGSAPRSGVGIKVDGDTTHENQEKFSVTLSKATGGAAVITDVSGTGTINTDE